MWVFIRCIIYQDYRTLKKSKGFIKMSKLKAAWDELFLQYIQQTGDSKNVILFNSVKEYQSLTTKIKVIYDCIEILSMVYSKDVAILIGKVGYPFNHTDVKSNEYQKRLASISSQAKRLVFEATKAKNAIDSFEENAGSETIKESDFDEMFLIMSKNQGYQMNAKNTTVSELISLIKLTEKQNSNVKRG